MKTLLYLLFNFASPIVIFITGFALRQINVIYSVLFFYFLFSYLKKKAFFYFFWVLVLVWSWYKSWLWLLFGTGIGLIFFCPWYSFWSCCGCGSVDNLNHWDNKSHFLQYILTYKIIEIIVVSIALDTLRLCVSYNHQHIILINMKEIKKTGII